MNPFSFFFFFFFESYFQSWSLFSFPSCLYAPLFGPIQCKSYFFLFYKQFPGYFVSFLLLLACVLGKYNSQTHTGLKCMWVGGDLLYLMFRKKKIHTQVPKKSNYPIESIRGCTILPVDKNSTCQKDQCSVKNLDSKDFHLRLNKERLNIQSINQSSAKIF